MALQEKAKNRDGKSHKARGGDERFIEVVRKRSSLYKKEVWIMVTTMRKWVIFLVVLSALITVIPLKANATPDIGIWPSYGADFGIFILECDSNNNCSCPSDTRKVWIKNEGTTNLTITGISSPSAPFSLDSPPIVPFTLTPGSEQDINIQLSPISAGN